MVRKTKERRRVRNNQSRKKEQTNDTKLHFYDYDESSFKGVTFTGNEEDVTKIMCTGNVICHKMPYHRKNKFTPAQLTKHMQRYVAAVSNPAMKEYIRFRHHQLTFQIAKNEELYPFFYLDDGITEKQLNDLSDPMLRNVKVVLSMEGMMSYGNYLYEMLLPGFVAKLSRVTKSNITDCDLGELIFGGKKKVAALRKMFHNLKNTIGLKNVYIITRNYYWYNPKHICQLFNCTFDIHFFETNLFVPEEKEKPYDFIKKLAFT